MVRLDMKIIKNATFQHISLPLLSVGDEWIGLPKIFWVNAFKKMLKKQKP